MSGPRRLDAEAVRRPWGGLGRPELGLAAKDGAPTGEWWVPTDGFPLLVKVIDAREFLSVQLHPDDAVAREMDLASGKTEAWYVLARDPGARILLGLKDGVAPDEFLDRAERGEDVSPLLESLEPDVGDVVFVPAGTVHAIGAGLVILETQQVSDTTFRVYDWNREPRRELHLAEARRAIRAAAGAGRADGAPARAGDGHVVRERLRCEKFVVGDLTCTAPSTVACAAGRAELWFCRDGRGRVAANGEHADVEPGRFVLVPGAIDAVTVTPASDRPLHAVRIHVP